MERKRVLIIGSGQRVREAALPAIARAKEHWDLAGVVSRQAKTIESGGKEHPVERLESLTPERLASIDLVYLVVSKSAVPTVLLRLGLLDLSGLDLLIETPVMLFRHLGYLGRLSPFRNVWVSEDCAELPCYDPLRAMVASGAVSEWTEARFDRSAYAYHGLAMAKAVLGRGPIRSARRRTLEGGGRERCIQLASGNRARIIEPRDYAKGRLSFTAAECTVADHQVKGPDTIRLAPIFKADRCVGFCADDVKEHLDDAEASLMGTPSQGEGVTAWMDGMKRVGFLRLLRSIGEGHGAYPLDEALEDAVVDYHLEKLGRYRSTLLTNPGSRLARFSYKLLTRLAGR